MLPDRFVHSGWGFNLAELAKEGSILAVIVAVASQLSRDAEATPIELLRVFAVAVLPSLLLLVADLRAACLCLAVSMTILFVADPTGVVLRSLALGLPLSMLPVYFVLFHVGGRRDRVLAFLNPYADPRGVGFHFIQLRIAIGSGGLSGSGYGQGVMKFGWVADPYGTGIFAVSAEEWGFVGCIFVVVVLATMLRRGYVASLRSVDTFGKLLALGITTWIALEIGLNLCPVLGLMPLSVLHPLPLFSYNPTGMIVSLSAMGVVLNVSSTSAIPPVWVARFVDSPQLFAKRIGTLLSLLGEELERSRKFKWVMYGMSIIGFVVKMWEKIGKAHK